MGIACPRGEIKASIDLQQRAVKLIGSALAWYIYKFPSVVINWKCMFYTYRLTMLAYNFTYFSAHLMHVRQIVCLRVAQQFNSFVTCLKVETRPETVAYPHQHI